MFSSEADFVQLAKYQVAFLNRQFIMIMCALGVPETFMLEIFKDALTSIQGLKARVKAGRPTKGDFTLMSMSSDVSNSYRIALTRAVPTRNPGQGRLP